ncbi:hypothetical protein [Microbacterium tumbae]
MIIWRGWGILAIVYALVAMILFAGLASTVLPEGALPFSIAIGLIIAAAATWFTGDAMNRTRPQGKVDAWARSRREQLDALVASGRFSLGPGQPQPGSLAEAQQMADALFEHEKGQTRRALNVHTVFWIPMQYLAFVWAGIAIVVLVLGAVSSLSGSLR